MNPEYAPLSQPFTLNNGVTAKSRLAVTSVTHSGSHTDGSINNQERTSIGNRAGDMGLFVAATVLVQDDGKAFPDQPEATDEHHLNSLKETARLIQKQGARATLQIHHGGYKVMAELNRCDKISTSVNEAEGAREANAAEVDELAASLARTADLAPRAGFDGMEIHSTNNYLIQQFYSAQSNHRSDKWDDSLGDRARFPLAVIDAIVAVHDKHRRNDSTISYRLSPEEAGEDRLIMTETGAPIDVLVQKPLQCLHAPPWEFDRKIRRGGDTVQTRIQFIYERINGKLPLIGVGNLFTVNQILVAYKTDWAGFITLGKTATLNLHIATQILEGHEAETETQLDTTCTNRYGFPDTLQKLAVSGTQSWLPSVKGTNQKPMNI